MKLRVARIQENAGKRFAIFSPLEIPPGVSLGAGTEFELALPTAAPQPATTQRTAPEQRQTQTNTRDTRSASRKSRRTSIRSPDDVDVVG